MLKRVAPGPSRPGRAPGNRPESCSAALPASSAARLAGPKAAERAAAAQANIEAKKPHDFRVTVDPDGSVIMTFDTGERVRLESA